VFGVHRTLGRNPSRRPALIAAILLLICSFGLVYATVGRASQTGPANMNPSGITESEAAQILGQPLPAPRTLPLGLSRSAIAADPVENNPTLAALGPRHVRESFAVGGKDVVLLIVNRGQLGRILDPGVSTAVLGGRSMIIASHQIWDGSTDVAYNWETDGLALTMHVNLVSGLTRTLSDQIAASVR